MLDLKKLETTIKEAEGLRLRMYKDTKGIRTIGYGFNLEANDIPLSVAEELFAVKFQEAILTVGGLPFFTSLSEPRQRALVEMAYIFGPRLADKWPTTLAYMEAGRWDRVRSIIESSPWMAQAPNRVKRILGLLMEGETNDGKLELSGPEELSEDR